MRITFVRHGQSEANAARRWQGQGSSPLTAEGRRQSEQLGARLAGARFDLVVSSDLERAVDTARLAGFEPEESAGWREGDLGAWDGLTEAEVRERFSDEFTRLRSGEDLRFGGTGESIGEVRARARAQLDELVGRLDHADHALVVAHGGIVGAVIRHVLGLPVLGRFLGLQANTAITEVDIAADGRMVLTRYGDAGHLGSLVGFGARLHSEGSTVVDLIRHGTTDANETGRVQGQMDWGLNERGRAQSFALRDWMDDVDTVFTSPLGRAAQTADLAFGHAHDPAHHDGLMEINMGEWEGHDWADIQARQPELVHLFAVDENFRRGGTGETYAQLRERAVATIDGMGNGSPGPRRIAAVSHGGTIGAYLRHLIGLDGDKRGRLARVSNTGASRVVFAEDGPLLIDFNVTYHLEAAGL